MQIAIELEKKGALLAVLAALSVPAGPAKAEGPPAEPSAHESRAAPVRVVATLPVYADVARAVGGAEVEVTSIADPNEDAHFVRPKPSFALELRRADLFITTGLDLELWVPTLLDRAGNSQVAEGGRGYVTAYAGVRLLDIPQAANRSAGDVHIFGNPHLTTDPLRTLQVARNITTGLRRVAPERADHFERGLRNFADRIYRKLFGDRLVELIGGETLEDLALSGNLFSFLREQEFEGQALLEELGGWLAAAAPLRGARIICYHKNWAYFEERFQVTCADYVEAKPGIPPTPRHVARLIEEMRSQNLSVLLAASHFDAKKVLSVAERGGAQAVIVPLYPRAREGVDDYFSLVDLWVDQLTRAYRQAAR